MNKYYFKVDVREGARGFADDDEYISKSYRSFEEVYEALFYFEPHRHWRYLRYVAGMNIWLDGQSMVDVCTCGSYEIDLKDLPTLYTTEEEFDRIIDKINRQEEEREERQMIVNNES